MTPWESAKGERKKAPSGDSLDRHLFVFGRSFKYKTIDFTQDVHNNKKYLQTYHKWMNMMKAFKTHAHEQHTIKANNVEYSRGE